MDSADSDDLRVAISRQACIGSGECARTVPEVFGQSRDGTALLRRPHPPRALADRVRRAASECPGGAIGLTLATAIRPAAPLTPEQAVRSYYSLVDANDFAALVLLFSEQAVYQRPGYPPIEGRAALAEFYATKRVIMRGRHVISELIADGSRVAVHGRFTGTDRSGTALALQFADFFTMDSAGLLDSRETFFFTPLA